MGSVLIRDLEGPMLGIKTFKTGPEKWLSRDLGSTDSILTLGYDDKHFFFPKGVKNRTYGKINPKQTKLDLPDAAFSAVYLYDILQDYDLEGRRALIKEAARVTANGGKVVAYSPACDDAREAYELVVPYGIDTVQFLKNRLKNKEIASLRPHEAAFFETSIVAPNRKRLVNILQEMDLDAKLEHMWEARERFAIRRFHVGMVWHVRR